MSLDFQPIRQQVKQLGETAVIRERELRDRRNLALDLLESNSQDLAGLKQKENAACKQEMPAWQQYIPFFGFYFIDRRTI